MIFPSTCRRPLLLAGNGLRAAGALAELDELRRRTQLPVLTSMSAVDLVQDEGYLGFIGAYGSRIAHLLLETCDTVVAVGIRLGLRQTGRNASRFASQARLIRCDIDGSELGRTLHEDEEHCLLDARQFLQQLLEEPLGDYGPWLERCRQAASLLEDLDMTDGNRAAALLGQLLADNALVCVDVGQHQCWCAQSLRLRGGQGRMLHSCGYGTMGCALPFAIGASLAAGRRQVCCICGDGGLQMNIQELQTLQRERLPVKIVVLNNRALGKIAEIQARFSPPRFAQTTAASGYSVPDFVAIARAYGLRARALQGYAELRQCREWLNDDQSCLIDVPLPEETQLIPKADFVSGQVLPEVSAELMARCRALLTAPLS